MKPNHRKTQSVQEQVKQLEKLKKIQQQKQCLYSY